MSAAGIGRSSNAEASPPSAAARVRANIRHPANTDTGFPGSPISHRPTLRAASTGFPGLTATRWNSTSPPSERTTSGTKS